MASSDWFGLKKALGFGEPQTAPQGNQDAGLDMGKLAAENAAQKLKQAPVAPSVPGAPAPGGTVPKPKKKTVAGQMASNMQDFSDPNSPS